MIKIQSLTIENFRGIIQLSCNMNLNSFVVSGPNGSGKSGIIDSIEFALTGKISRLSGSGTANLTIGTHAPHVNYRHNPEKARVIIEVINEKTGNTFLFERIASSPQKSKITPDNEEAKEILYYLNNHPEFSLSRKEILKFILTEPGKRAQEVQSLLKMNSVNKIRRVLKSLDNKLKTESNEKQNDFNRLLKDFLNYIGIIEIDKLKLLEKINEKRAILSLHKLKDINNDTKFSFGFDERRDAKNQVEKKLLNDRITKIFHKIQSSDSDIEKKINSGRLSIKELKNNPEFLFHISKNKFYESSLELIIDNSCPLCDTIFDIHLLKQHIYEKIEKNKAIIALRDSIIDCSQILKSDLQSLCEDIKEVIKDALKLKLIPEKDLLTTLLEKFKLDINLLNNPLESLDNITLLFDSPYSKFNEPIKDALNSILETSEKIPDYSIEEKAKQFLIVADEMFKNYRRGKSEKKIYEERCKITSHLLNKYEKISEEKLTNIYKEVEKYFSTFYSQINNDNEENFSAQLNPSSGSLDLKVDFYNKGFFPPNAFHSEGHQDSMGICLYLALAKNVMRGNFTFCLLDDVLMSIDASHRREFCRLLKSEFPTTQFIITTHDEIWKKQLVNSNIVTSKQVINFRTWSVENGPSILDEKEAFIEIEKNIGENNIREAASALRHYLEYIMMELCIKFRTKLEFRQTLSYDLGELLPSVVSQYKDYLRKAKIAANSWNQKPKLDEISILSKKFDTCYQATKAEQWTLNPAIHYNEWANFTSNEFIPLKETFFEFLDQFKPKCCNEWLYISPIKGNAEQLRCNCGIFNLNFNEK